MRKFFLSLIFCFLSFGAFAFHFDILGSPFYSFSSVSGKTNKYGTNTNIDYKSDLNAAGVSFGFDIDFNSSVIGIYSRYGFVSPINLKKTIGNSTETFSKNTTSFSYFFNAGPLFTFNINNYFKICAAPAFSMFYFDYTTSNFKSIYSARATVESILSFGVSADIYAKFRYKHFVATAGCAFAFYPSNTVTSSDSNLTYSSDIRDVFSYNIRPYISAGVSLY